MKNKMKERRKRERTHHVWHCHDNVFFQYDKEKACNNFVDLVKSVGHGGTSRLINLIN